MTLYSLSPRICGRFRYYCTQLFGRRSIRLANRTPVISFTFDDFPRTALHSGGAILQEFGVTATYYASLGLMNQESPVGRVFSEPDLREVLDRGHELGCHTFDHYHAWNTLPKTFEQSILKNREALSRLLPGVSFSTLSYPRSIPRPQTKRRAQKYFMCCRGGGYEPINTREADLNFLNAFFLEKSRGDTRVPKNLIDRNRECCGWLIFGTHDIDNHPSQFGCTPSFFKSVVSYAVASGTTILPVAAALRKIHTPNI